MQNNEFNFAYLQAKALDKRLNEEGERLYDLAETFLDNNYFDLAVKCYQYIIDKGSNNYYFIEYHSNKGSFCIYIKFFNCLMIFLIS